MDLINNILLGLSVAITPANLLYVLIGCVLGTLIGVLPGIGPMATMSMLMPITFSLSPESAVIMLAGIYYGAMYGGSTTSILVNLPGETSSVVTCIDGHKMAQQGKAGKALATAALGSLFAGFIGVILLATFSAPMTEIAFEFGAPDFFSLILLGLVGSIIITSGPLLNSLGMVIIGLLLSTVGADIETGIERYTLGLPELYNGVGFIVIAMGLFGYSEIISNLSLGNINNRELLTNKISGLFPNRQDFKNMTPAILRGTFLGSVLGALPGGGAILASFSSYTMESKVKLKPGEVPLGEGNIRGVAGPESANNAAAQTSFIPMLTLGIPSNAIMALMIGTLIMHGIQPGPQVINNNPELFWGLTVSMIIGNIMLVILNLPLIGIWVRMLNVPYRLLFPSVVVFCVIGVYCSTYSVFDVALVGIFGIVGYVLVQLKLNPVPLIMGFILGPMLEVNFRRSLVLSNGHWDTFINRPISLTLLVIIVILFLVTYFSKIKK